MARLSALTVLKKANINPNDADQVRLIASNRLNAQGHWGAFNHLCLVEIKYNLVNSRPGGFMSHNQTGALPASWPYWRIRSIETPASPITAAILAKAPGLSSSCKRR